ncbi:cell surface protein [Phenylobacterium sp.]|uniref:cell surface protein n=1 Tax=Phenylobacterium sp. TaxID=1871053 RepID=UPI002B6972AF|nr:cell surface protein [Phenylobacterium sp.]HLZ76882.1 cell surface protein [Phenylobacterium sp.]
MKPAAKLVMRNSHLAIVLGLWLALAACSKATTEKTGDDLKAVGHDAAAAAKDVTNAPAAKELGSDIKQGTEEAAAKTKAAADEAGEKLKEGAKDAGDKTDAALNKAKDDVSKK